MKAKSISAGCCTGKVTDRVLMMIHRLWGFTRQYVHAQSVDKNTI